MFKMASKNAQAADSGFYLFIESVKLLIFAYICVIKLALITEILMYAAPSLVEYIPNSHIDMFLIGKNYINPVFIFVIIWGIVHAMNNTYGKERYYITSVCFFFHFLLFDDLDFKNYTTIQWITVVPLTIGLLVFIWDSIMSLKISLEGGFFLVAGFFLLLPMKVVYVVHMPLYDYMVKKVWWRLDVNNKFYSPEFKPKEGEVDPRDGKTFYQSSEWRKLRYKAFEKYGTTCMDPDCHNPATHVDHVKPRSLRPDLALSLNNLQVLCEKCNKMKSNRSDVDFRPPHLRK